MKRVCMFLSLLAATIGPSLTFAGNGPFFVVYDHHPEEKGEVEVMLMNDFNKSRVGRDNYAQMVEVEYGVTDRWTSEFMLEGQKTTGDSWVYTGWRWENRYRLFEEELPVNPMIYAEWENLNGATKYKMEVSGNRDLEPVSNTEAKKEKERILETRLILGKEFGPLTVAFDWINESDTLRRFETAFGYAMGFRYTIGVHAGEHLHRRERRNGDNSRWIVGMEMYGGLGDTKSFGIMPKKQEHYLAPVVMWHAYNVMFHFSPAIGLTDASDKYVLRTAIGWEF